VKAQAAAAVDILVCHAAMIAADMQISHKDG